MSHHHLLFKNIHENRVSCRSKCYMQFLSLLLNSEPLADSLLTKTIYIDFSCILFFDFTFITNIESDLILQIDRYIL